MAKNVNNIFGERLRALRKESGMSQEELGKKINLSRTAVSYYEKGERTPNTEIIKTIAKHFNCSSDYLMGSVEILSSDFKIRAAVDHLGLTEKAATILLNGQVLNQKGQLDIFNRLIEAEYESAYLSDNIEDINESLDNFNDINFYPNLKYQPILSTIINYIAFEDGNTFDENSAKIRDIQLLVDLHEMIKAFRRNWIESKQQANTRIPGGQ